LPISSSSPKVCHLLIFVVSGFSHLIQFYFRNFAYWLKAVSLKQLSMAVPVCPKDLHWAFFDEMELKEYCEY
jgi:hypothetical protein